MAKFEKDLTKVSDAAYIRAITSSGESVQISKADLASVLGGLPPLSAATDNVFIMTHRKSDNYPFMYKPEFWTAQQNDGEVADGVVVVSGNQLLVIAPTEGTQMLWSSAAISGGGKTTSDRQTAYEDYIGRANTTAQLTHNECNGADYAAGYCNSYARANANGQGLTAGKWWLPSMGEMMLIFAHMKVINSALSLITGAAQLSGDAYWTSTEYSSTDAWNLFLNCGFMNFSTKATSRFRVRPVSAFIS